MSALILSDDERWLIGLMWADVAAVVGWPDYDIPRLRESRHESCGHGIHSRVTSKGLEARQHEWLPVPIVGGWPLYERGDLLRECSMTWARLRKWVDSLPEEVVATAKRSRDLTRDPQITTGRDRLFTFMESEGWIYRGAGERRKPWRAYQAQVDLGRLTERISRPYLNERTGEMTLPDPTVRITAKGLAKLHLLLGGSGSFGVLAVTA